MAVVRLRGLKMTEVGFELVVEDTPEGMSILLDCERMKNAPKGANMRGFSRVIDAVINELISENDDKIKTVYRA
jgi:hypothetical protein